MPSSNHSTYRPSSVSRRAPYQGSSYVPGYSSGSGSGSGHYGSHQSNPPPQQQTAQQQTAQQQLQTQQIYIPNDLVGCIIGKGGAKINEIRHMSASQIKIMEPGAAGVGPNGAPAPAGGEGERLVVITGQPANIQMAVQLLYHVSSFFLRAVVIADSRIAHCTALSETGTGETEAAPLQLTSNKSRIVSAGYLSNCGFLNAVIVNGFLTYCYRFFAAYNPYLLFSKFCGNVLRAILFLWLSLHI